MESLGIREQDLEESFVRGAGRGGQKVNKTNNCVYLKHVPTGIAVKCHVDRSRELNRFLARRELCDAVERAADRPVRRKARVIQRMRKQKDRRRRRSSAHSRAASGRHVSNPRGRTAACIPAPWAISGSPRSAGRNWFLY